VRLCEGDSFVHRAIYRLNEPNSYWPLSGGCKSFHVVVATFARTDKYLEGAFFERPQLTGQLIVGAVKARMIQIVSVLIHLQSKVN
jgi:hypothetical protein